VVCERSNDLLLGPFARPALTSRPWPRTCR
jgi:hypothetical protein